MVVGIRSGFGHSGGSPKLVTAEGGPSGSTTVIEVTGTSGVVAKFVVVIPPVIFVCPTRITRTPSPWRIKSRSGNAPPPWETKIAGPLSRPGSTGVRARTEPTNEPLGQLKGLLSKVAARHALFRVDSRETSCLGSCTSTDLTFALPAGM